MLASSSEEESCASDNNEVDLEEEISISPFHKIGSWDKETLANVCVQFLKVPKICGNFEIHPINFKNGLYSSDTLKINNVSIPFSSDKGYGHDYIYICLPDVIEELVKTNAARKFPNLIASKYYGEAGEWWKPAYDIKGVFKVADKNLICTPVSLEKILNHTKMGVRANIQAEFSVKRRLFSVENIIKVKILNAFITSTDVDAKLPTPVGIIPGQPMPQDITSDDTMKILEQLRDAPS